MPDCILHYGLPKTGSTAIQMALGTSLSDPRFRYGSFQNPPGDGGDHGRSLAVMFSDNAASYHLNVQDGLDASELSRLRHRLFARFDDEIGRLGNATLILHAESLPFLSAAELARFRDYTRARGISLRPVGYVRPFRDGWESMFVQLIKSGIRMPAVPLLFGSDHPSPYHRFLADLDDLFGRDGVHLWIYERRSFPAGCVVTDFCRRLGIESPPAVDPSANPGISLDAVRLLYACRTRTQAAAGITDRTADALLVKALGELHGPRFRFHPALVAQAIEKSAGHLDWLEERVGASLREGLDDDHGPLIRTEEDLLDFSPESLDWLARRTGTPAGDLAGKDPRAVAEAVGRLREIAVAEEVAAQRTAVGPLARMRRRGRELLGRFGWTQGRASSCSWPSVPGCRWWQCVCGIGSPSATAPGAPFPRAPLWRRTALRAISAFGATPRSPR